MSKANNDIKHVTENSMALTAVSAAVPVSPATTAAIAQPHPQKLKDLPVHVQALMPKAWDKEADIFSPVPPESLINHVDPTTAADPYNSKRNALLIASGFQLEAYQSNYFMWAIFNHRELARNMIVAGVDPNVQVVNSKKTGHQSPLIAALNDCQNPLLVEYLCMANVNLVDVRIFKSHPGMYMGYISLLVSHSVPRSILSTLYEKGQNEYLNEAEQALLNHVYFATATESLYTQLRSLISSEMMPPPLFKIIFDYICEYNPALMALLEKANVQFMEDNQGTYFAPSIRETSLVKPFHQLAKGYFENTQIIREQRAKHEAEQDNAAGNKGFGFSSWLWSYTPFAGEKNKSAAASTDVRSASSANGQNADPKSTQCTVM